MVKVKDLEGGEIILDFLGGPNLIATFLKAQDPSWVDEREAREKSTSSSCLSI